MNKKYSKVFIIDDDDETRQGLTLLLKSYRYNVISYQGVEEFIKNENYSGGGCILLDVFLKGRTGLELQAEIESKFECLPIIFMSGRGNISMSVEALKKGAINFLQKPIDEEELIKAIDEALSTSEAIVARYNEIDRIRTLIHSLTAREFEIFRYVITGLLNKQIAIELGISEHTIKNHRLKITEKLGVKSVAEMVYMAEKLSIRSSIANHSS